MKKGYSNYFSETALWEKIRDFSKAAGEKVVYAVLLLYYLMAEKSVSLKTKASIAAALGYFIFPLDAVPDLAPLIGYSDDLGVLLFVLSKVAGSLTPEVKQRAQKQLEDWFGKTGQEELMELEDPIS